MKDTVFVLYDKINFEIITITDHQIPKISKEQYLIERVNLESKCQGRNIDDFAVIETDRETYYKIVKDIKFYDIVVDPLKQDLVYITKKNETHNCTYNIQDIKRNFSYEEITKMYYEDYINVNLRNCLSNQSIDYEFIKLKDLKLRTQMFNKNWNYFYSDPFLAEASADKILLGKEIIERGMYWPVVVAPMYNNSPNDNYVFEGTHRIISLKLCAMEGFIDDNFEVFCLKYSENYEQLNVLKQFLPLQTPYKVRNLLEILYGNRLIVDEERLAEVLNSVSLAGDKMIDTYTIEYTAQTIHDEFVALQTYPHWLRDLIYTYKDTFKPSSIFQNKTNFEEWLNGPT